MTEKGLRKQNRVSQSRERRNYEIKADNKLTIIVIGKSGLRTFRIITRKELQKSMVVV